MQKSLLLDQRMRVQILSLLSKEDKVKLILVLFGQFCLALVDLLSISIIGLIGALSVYGIQSKEVNSSTKIILEFFQVESLIFQKQVAILGIIACLLFVFKTIFSFVLIRKTIRFMANKSATISSKFVRNTFSLQLSHIQKYSQQELLFTATNGIEIILTKIIGGFVILLSDLLLLIIIFLGLFVVSPEISISIFFVFFIVALSLNRIMHNSASKLGKTESQLIINNNQKFIELLNTYREAFVRNSRDNYIRNFVNSRFTLANVITSRSLMPQLSKYIIEITVVVGSLIVAGFQFAIVDASTAISRLVFFFAAASRVAPAVLRIQQGSTSIKGSEGMVEKTLEILNFANNHGTNIISSTKKIDFEYQGFIPEISCSDVSYSHNSNSNFEINNFNLTILPGEFVAIVGKSGAGKSTIVDLLLGIREPISGFVSINKLPPNRAIKGWPGAISYIPQNVSIINGSILENITLGQELLEVSMSNVWESLKVAQLEDFVKNLPQMLETQIGDFGFNLSGGQKQRLGIARAVYTKPKILVMDESTSSLDNSTEQTISNTIHKLNGKTTIVMIAHRLSTIMNANRIVFLKNGLISSIGNYDELMQIEPDFKEQVIHSDSE
jgi:ABC-type multidrug transport system fused ATPase/permease subunit